MTLAWLALRWLGTGVALLGAALLALDLRRLVGGTLVDPCGEISVSLAITVAGVLVGHAGRQRHPGWWIGGLGLPFLLLGIAFLGVTADELIAGGPTLGVLFKSAVSAVVGGIGVLSLVAAAWWRRRRAAG